MPEVGADAYLRRFKLNFFDFLRTKAVVTNELQEICPGRKM